MMDRVCKNMVIGTIFRPDGYHISLCRAHLHAEWRSLASREGCELMQYRLCDRDPTFTCEKVGA